MATPGNPFVGLAFTPKAVDAPTIQEKVTDEVNKLLNGVVKGVADLVRSRVMAYARLWRLKLTVAAGPNNQAQVLNTDSDVTPDLMAQGLGNKFGPLVQLDALTVEFLSKLNALLAEVGADTIPADCLAGIPEAYTLGIATDGSGNGTITKKPVTVTPVT